jgi:hypothetical protein
MAEPDAVITITKATSSDGRPEVYVDALAANDGDLSVCEALGLLEMAKVILLDQGA